MGQRKVSIRVSVPATGFRRRMFFNRLAVEDLDGHLLLCFGLVDPSGSLRDSYCCVITKQTFQESREGLAKYFADLGAPQAAIPRWSPPSQSPIDLANFILVGHQGQGEAEVVLCAFAVAPALQRAKEKQGQDPIVLDPVAYLRCDLELQRHFLRILLEKGEK